MAEFLITVCIVMVFAIPLLALLALATIAISDWRKP